MSGWLDCISSLTTMVSFLPSSSPWILFGTSGLGDRPLVYWPSGIVLCAVSTLISLHFIRKKTHLWEKVSGKFKMKWRRHQ